MRYLIILLFTAFFLNCNFSYTQPEFPKSINGVLDLSHWNFDEQGTVDLSGDWEFYWMQLIDPNHKSNIIEKNKTGYMQPGSRWEGQSLGEMTLSGIGYATYRLKILFPKEVIGKIIGIKFKTTGGLAYKLFIDKELHTELGKVGIRKEEMIPTRKTNDLYFTVQSTETMLTIQMSNFYHADGSFWYIPEMGSISQITFLSKRKQAIDAAVFGSIFIMALYHLSIFIYQKQNKTALYFGLFCLSVSVYVLLVNEVFIYYFFPNLSFSLAHRLLVIYYLLTPLYLSFLYTLFPSEFPKSLLKIVWIIFSLMYSFIFFTNLEVGSKIERPSIFLVASAFLFALFIVTKSLIQKRNLSLYIFIPNLIFVLSVINDILTIYSYINTPIILSYAIFIFITFQSIILALHFSKITIEVEDLSKQLQIINQGLEERIEERTIQFKEEKDRAIEANLWKNKFIELVSHDLRSPLFSIYNILSILESEKSLTEKEKQYFIGQSKTIIQNATSTVKHLLNLSRFQTGSVQVFFIDIELYSTIETILIEFSNELSRKNIKINNLVPMDIIITVDKDITLEVFRNIIMNAIKFSMNKGEITINYSENKWKQIVSISDTGVGIPIEIQENLFKKEVSTQGTMGETGFGIGLKRSYEMMHLQKGSIEVETQEGVGSKFSIFFENNENTIMLIGNTKYIYQMNNQSGNKKYLIIQTKNIFEAIERLDKVYCKAIIISKDIPFKDIDSLIHTIHSNSLYKDKPIIILNNKFITTHENVFILKTLQEVLNSLDLIK